MSKYKINIIINNNIYFIFAFEFFKLLPMSTLPNFLIVGAAKCGTSSLANYINQHPEVYISTPKEPRFISSQFTEFPLQGPLSDRLESWYIKTYEDYLKLFEEANSEKAIGEASVDNLFFYNKSIPLIKKYLGEPKIIIMLRHPVRRAFSAYSHMIRDKREPLSFEHAIDVQEERLKNNWEFLYCYLEASKYYNQVKAYKNNFRKTLIILTEDLHKNPGRVFHEIFSFLEVDPRFQVDQTIKHNKSGVPKFRMIHNFFKNDNKLRLALQPLTRLFIPSKLRQKLSYRIQSSNLTKLEIAPNTYEKLVEVFKEDVIKLQGIIDKDLSHWLK